MDMRDGGVAVGGGKKRREGSTYLIKQPCTKDDLEQIVSNKRASQLEWFAIGHQSRPQYFHYIYIR